jgi:regulatory protein
VRDRSEKAGRKPPRKVTPVYLQRAALAYLERYASSAGHLHRILMRKVEKRCRLRGEDPAEFREAIDEVVAKSIRLGLVDDARYAQARVASLRRRGGSARAIRAKLSSKGVESAIIADALHSEEDEDEKAAHALARRRKLGPFRAGERAPYRDKDIAVLARAGFAFGTARRIVDAAVDGDGRALFEE